MPVKVPVPSAFATDTEPVPLVTTGPVSKNTLIPAGSAVVPSGVPIASFIRFCTVTSNW